MICVHAHSIHTSQAGSLPALIAAAVALGTGKGSELNNLRKTNDPFVTNSLDDLVELRDNTYSATSMYTT